MAIITAGWIFLAPACPDEGAAEEAVLGGGSEPVGGSSSFSSRERSSSGSVCPFEPRCDSIIGILSSRSRSEAAIMAVRRQKDERIRRETCRRNEKSVSEVSVSGAFVTVTV